MTTDTPESLPAFPDRCGKELQRDGGYRAVERPGMSLRDYASIHFTAAWIVALSKGGSPTETVAAEAERLGQEQAENLVASRSRATA